MRKFEITVCDSGFMVVDNPTFDAPPPPAVTPSSQAPFGAPPYAPAPPMPFYPKRTNHGFSTIEEAAAYCVAAVNMPVYEDKTK
jgi:hypothetical protein